MCGCDAAKIDVVHLYLKEHFPDYALRDFHAPSRLMQAGLPGPQTEHHVVGLLQTGVLPYYAVLMNDFQQRTATDVSNCMQRWKIADLLRAHRITIVAKDGASSL